MAGSGEVVAAEHATSKNSNFSWHTAALETLETALTEEASILEHWNLRATYLARTVAYLIQTEGVATIECIDFPIPANKPNPNTYPPIWYLWTFFFHYFI